MKSIPITNQKHPLQWVAPTALFITGLALFQSGPSGMLLGNLCFVALVVWCYLRCRNSEDEVVQAAKVAAMATGAPIGLGLAFGSIFIVRLHPTATEWVTGMTREAASPATAGFGMGILFTCLLVAGAVGITWIGWWAAKR